MFNKSIINEYMEKHNLESPSRNDIIDDMYMITNQIISNLEDAKTRYNTLLNSNTSYIELIQTALILQSLKNDTEKEFTDYLNSLS